MTKPTEEKQRRQKFYRIIGVIVVAVIIIFFINQQTGPSSTVEIAPVGSSASVFIDRSRTSSLNPNSPTTYSVSSGYRQILIARDGYWPWTEGITIESEETISLNPFLIEEAGQRAIQIPDSISNALVDKRNKPTPSATNPAVSPNEDIHVYVEGETNIIAQWTAGTSSAPDYFNCLEDTCVASVYNNQAVRDIAFYPDRNDVIFVATDTGVFAIELDPSRDTQNFQPVVEGVSNPVFVLDENRIFVSAGNRVTVSRI